MWRLIRAGDVVLTPTGPGRAHAVFVGARMVQVVYPRRNAGLLVPLDDVQFVEPSPGDEEVGCENSR